jgi:hypothetical protein
VAAAECYLLEWVRDDVLKHDYRELQKYFPDGAFRPVADDNCLGRLTTTILAG